MNQSKSLLIACFMFPSQVKLPFEKLIHGLKNFPEDAMNPDTLLPLAYSIKVLFLPVFHFYFHMHSRRPKKICFRPWNLECVIAGYT